MLGVCLEDLQIVNSQSVYPRIAKNVRREIIEV